MSQAVPTTNISFPDEEEKILKYWKEIDAFKTSLKQSKGKPRSVRFITAELSKTIGPVGRADENLSGSIVSSKTSVQMTD